MSDPKKFIRGVLGVLRENVSLIETPHPFSTEDMRKEYDAALAWLDAIYPDAVAWEHVDGDLIIHNPPIGLERQSYRALYYTTTPPQEPTPVVQEEGTVRLPTSTAEAQLMIRLGTMWLEQNVLGDPRIVITTPARTPAEPT